MIHNRILIIFAVISLFFFPHVTADTPSKAPAASDVFETTEINIIEPRSLSTAYDNLIGKSLSIANFGQVPWGRTLIGHAYLANPLNACSKLKPPVAQHDNENPDAEDPDHPIIFATRGDCTFDTKALNAQMIGAKTIFIIDNVEGENLNYLIPIQDKLGDSVYIPTVLLDKRSGELIKKELEKTPPVAVSLSISFELPKALNKTKVDLWLTSSDPRGFEFVNSLQEIRKKLKDSIEFTPHPVLWYCLQCERRGFVGTDTDPNCVSSGRHCSPDPDAGGPLNGSQVLLEDLRQLCLFNHNQDAWWAYFASFNKSCLNTAYLQQCSHEAIKNIGVSVSTINDCVTDSFGGGDIAKAENKIFAKESEAMKANMIRLWPTLLINKQMYRGNLFPSDSIFEAICDGFANPPRECIYDDIGVVPPLVRYEKHYPGLIIALVVVVLAILFVTIFICYKRRLRSEVNKEMEFMITSTMQKYVQLKE